MARKRQGISTRTRFEIFKRDGFRCGYCGATPNDALLHVDHIKPKADGGTDDNENLITACDRCNLGKSSVPLDQHRFAVGDPERAREHAKQLKAYMEAQREVATQRQAVVKELIDLWCSTLGTDTYHKNLEIILPKALSEFGMAKLCDYMAIVAQNRNQWEYKKATFEIDCKYFCGILRKRREGWG